MPGGAPVVDASSPEKLSESSRADGGDDDPEPRIKVARGSENWESG